MGSLIYVRGQARNKKFTRDKKLETAKRCGINLVELEWLEPISTTISVEGFQSVECAITRRPNSRRMQQVVDWRKNEFGDDVPYGQLTFIPDELEIGRAWMPDSPYNRRMLAIDKLGPVHQWQILDKGFNAEIDKLAKLIEESEEFQRALKDLEERRLQVEIELEESARTGGPESRGRMLQEQKALERRIEELEAAKRVKELKAKIAALEAGEKEPMTSEEIDTRARREYTDAEIKKLRREIANEVYEENAQFVEELKAQYSKWYLSPPYRDKLKPIIEDRLQKRLEGSNVGDDSGLHNEDQG